jgi:hypothetical protein
MASAAGFRVLNFGDPCESARGLEKVIGSREITWSGLSADVPAFAGRAFDREVSISYFCLHGKFMVGNYFFPMQSLDNAVQSLHEAYDSLVSQYGALYTDNSPWHGANSRFVAAEVDPTKYTAYWRGERINAVMSLRPSGGAGAQWQVAIALYRRPN